MNMKARITDDAKRTSEEDGECENPYIRMYYIILQRKRNRGWIDGKFLSTRSGHDSDGAFSVYDMYVVSRISVK